MVVNTLKDFLPILGFVLFLIIISMMIISYFNINMNDNGGLLKLNRVAIHEGMCSDDNCDNELSNQGLDNKKTQKFSLLEGNVGLMETENDEEIDEEN